MCCALVALTRFAGAPMPRSARPPATEVSFVRRTAGELAACLGVHRNTLAAWTKEPSAPQTYDECAWRIWAVMQATRSRTGGFECPRDPEVALWKALADAGIGTYRSRLAINHPTLGTGPAPSVGVVTAAKEPVPLNDIERKAKAEADAAEVKASDLKRASDIRAYRLLEVEDIHPLLDAWLAAIADTIVARVEAVPSRVTVAPDIQAALRIEIDTALREGSAQLADTVLANLQSFLGTLVGKHE